MKRFLLLLIFITFCVNVLAQQKSNVHIVTKKRNLTRFERFHFEVNGQHFKLDDGKCIDMQLNTDSIRVQVFDETVFHKIPAHDLRVAAAEEIYIFIYKTFEGAFKGVHLIAEVICKSCYEELKAKCK